MSLNHIVLTGHLPQDSEVRYTVSGQPVLQFNLAYPSGDSSEETNYVRVVSRRDVPPQLAYQLRKGTLVLIEGQLLTRTYTKKSGFHQKSVEISLDHLRILHEKENT